MRKSLVKIFNFMVNHKGEEVTPKQVDQASGKQGYSSKHMSMLRRWGCKVETIRGVTAEGGNGREALAYRLIAHPSELPVLPTNLKHPKGKKRPRRDAQVAAGTNRRSRTPEQVERPARPRVSIARSAKRSRDDAAPEHAANGQSPPVAQAGGDNFPQTNGVDSDFVRDMGVTDRNLCPVDPEFAEIANEFSDVDSLLDNNK